MSQAIPQKARAREDLCRFLSACYYEPTGDFSEERLFDSMATAAEAIHPELAEHARKLGDAFMAQDMQTLLVDYTRLFLGPPRPLASPYGSSWLTGETTLMQDSTMAVLEFYQQGGFDIGEDFPDLPDHVAVELEFLYLLIFRQNQAEQTTNLDDLTATEQLRHHFLGRHLGAWMGAFAAAVKSEAETVFYRELAELTERFVRMEVDSLRQN